MNSGLPPSTCGDKPHPGRGSAVFVWFDLHWRFAFLQCKVCKY